MADDSPDDSVRELTDEDLMMGWRLCRNEYEEWRAVGVHDVSVIGACVAFNLKIEMREQWEAQFGTLADAVLWAEYFSYPTDARTFYDAGFHPEYGSWWSDNGFSAKSALRWCLAGFRPDDAKEWRDAGFNRDEALLNLDSGRTVASAIEDRNFSDNV